MTGILDIRDLADSWQELCDEIDETGDTDLKSECAPYEDLCQELGCDVAPDELRRWGEDYEPTLIPESEFQDYAQELAEDFGAIGRNASWPLTCIDWEHAARELAYDYSLISFDGESYYVRSL